MFVVSALSASVFNIKNRQKNGLLNRRQFMAFPYFRHCIDTNILYVVDSAIYNFNTNEVLSKYTCEGHEMFGGYLGVGGNNKTFQIKCFNVRWKIYAFYIDTDKF